jgi:hypothetical protein
VAITVLVVFSLVVGILAFWEPNAELMSSLSGGLVTFTGATFGIIGIWLTLLNPLRVFDTGEAIDEGKQLLIDKLRPFFKLSILAFAVAIALRLIVAVTPPVIAAFSKGFVSLVEAVSDVSVTVPQTVTEWTYLVARASVGSLLMFLYMAQIVVILANLLPLFDSERKEKEREWEQAKDTRKHQNVRH